MELVQEHPFSNLSSRGPNKHGYYSGMQLDSSVVLSVYICFISKSSVIDLLSFNYGSSSE